MLTDTVTTEGTLEGFTPCSIDPENMGLAMKMYSRAYTRPADALIRELAVNGYDSHRAAGNPDPIRISLPTLDKPYLTVSDQGVGMSPETIVDVYGKYLSSTKDDDDPLSVGVYGIGAKVPYAVATQFHVTAIKDGIKTLVLFVLQKNNVPGYKILSTEPTTERNGLTISVPIDLERADTTYLQAAERVFFWWEKDTFFVEEFQSMMTFPCYRDYVLEDNSTDEVMVIKAPERLLPGHMVRMGPIGYEIPQSILGDIQTLERGTRFLVNAPVKSYPITPAREGIEATEGASALLKDLIKRWREAMIERHGAAYEKAKTSAELFALWEASETFVKSLMRSYSSPDYRAYDLPEWVEVPNVPYLDTRPRDAASQLGVYDLQYLNKAVFIEMVEAMDKKQQRILQEWRRANDNHVVFLIWDRDKMFPLIDPDTLEWTTFQELKDSTPKRARKVTPPEDIRLERIQGNHMYHGGRMQANELNIAQIQKLVDDGRRLVIGSRAEIEEERFRQYEPFTKAVFINRANRSAETVVKLIGRPHFTPASYRAKLRSTEVAKLSPEMRQKLANRAVFPYELPYVVSKFLRNTTTAQGKTLEALLQPLTELKDLKADPYLVEDPAMPEPTLFKQMPLALALLNCSNDPDVELLTTLLQLDAKNAAAAEKKVAAKLARKKGNS